MSNHLDPLSNPLNIETIQEIDNLDLPIMQKHHLRILAHCLQILKIINVDNSFEYQNKFSYAPIFLIIGFAVLLMRALSPYLGKGKSNA